MPTVVIHTPSANRASDTAFPLPPLLETPLGLAILELQGTINFPAPPASASSLQDSTEVGRLEFPDYTPSLGKEEGPWMRRIWLFIGHQRMTGEVKALSPPLGLLRRRQVPESTHPRKLADQDDEMPDFSAGHEHNDVSVQNRQAEEELEIVEVVKWKIVFRSRPEPVGSLAE